MFMRMGITSNINSALLKTKSVKEFMKFVEECSQTTDKSLVRTLMNTLTIMKFDDSCTMHEHVIEMINIATRLKSLFWITIYDALIENWDWWTNLDDIFCMLSSLRLVNEIDCSCEMKLWLLFCILSIGDALTIYLGEILSFRVIQVSTITNYS